MLAPSVFVGARTNRTVASSQVRSRSSRHWSAGQSARRDVVVAVVAVVWGAARDGGGDKSGEPVRVGLACGQFASVAVIHLIYIECLWIKEREKNPRSGRGFSFWLVPSVRQADGQAGGAGSPSVSTSTTNTNTAATAAYHSNDRYIVGKAGSYHHHRPQGSYRTVGICLPPKWTGLVKGEKKN